MATGYYDRKSGNDSTGTGAIGAPTKTITTLISVMTGGTGLVSGDTIAGAHAGATEAAIDLNSTSNVTHIEWAGVDGTSIRSVMTGATVVPAVAWSISSGTTYQASIGAGLTISNVSDMLSVRVLPDGRRYGWLAKGTVSSGAMPAAGQWDYNSGTGVLYVRLIDNTDPGTAPDQIEYIIDSNVSLITAQAAGSTFIGNGQKFGFVNAFSSTGLRYLVTIGGEGSIFRNYQVEGGENHAISNISSGGASSRVLIEDVVSWGMGKTLSASSFVAFANAGDVDGAIFRRCTAHVYSLLDGNGNPLLFDRAWTPQATPVSIQGFYAHTDGTAGREVTNLLYDECVCVGYGTTPTTHNQVQAFNAGNVVALPGGLAYRDYNQYAVRANRGRGHGISAHNISCTIAHRKCFFDYTKAKLITSGSFIGSVLGNNTEYHESGVFVFNTDRGSSNRSCWHLYAGARLVLHHCTIIIVGTVNWWHDLISVASGLAYGTSAGFKFEMKGCIVYFTQPNGATGNENRIISGDSAAPAGNFDIDGCVYHGVAPNAWSEATSRNSFSEFLDPATGIDKRGRVLDPLFVDPLSIDHLVAGRLARNSPLRLPSSKRIFAPLAGKPSDALGYLNTPYDGTVGAYQHGTGMARLSRDLRTGRVART